MRGRARPPVRLGGRLLAWLPVAWKRWLSPFLPRSCRFSPTCSEYARLALIDHGALRGSAYALWRVARCSPLSAGGIDLPPRRRSAPVTAERPVPEPSDPEHLDRTHDAPLV